MINEEKRISIPFKGEYVSIVEVFQPKKETGWLSSGYGERQLFTVIVAATSMKDLEDRTAELKKALDHQGWETR